MVFTGAYEHTIDNKNRLAIPAEIRAQIQAAAVGADAKRSSRKSADGSIHLYVTLGEGASLCLYTEAGFNQRADELDHSELDADQLLLYEHLKYTLSRRLELDKQGRVRLPEDLLMRAKLNRDIVLLGVKDHLEIRDRKTWNEFIENILATQPGILMNPRRAMRKNR